MRIAASPRSGAGAVTMPRRVRRSRKKGTKTPEGVIYCGRPTIRGNPFDWRRFGIARSVRIYELWIDGKLGALALERLDFCVLELDLLAALVPLSRVVITNTPFALAHRMIVHLLGRLDVDYLALLLKTTFFSTSSEDRGRVGLWRDHPPSRRWDMGWRPDFLEGSGRPGQGSTMLCSWFVWDKLRPNPLGADFYGMVPTGLLLRDGPVRFGRQGGLDFSGDQA
jgi:hypothetical protein